MVFLNVSSQFIVADFVAFLVFAVVGQILLDCIVGKMDPAVAAVKRVLARCGTDIAVFIPITLDDSLGASHHDVVSEVEFAFEVEEGTLDVGLDDVGAETTVGVSISLLQNGFDFLESQAHLDAVTPVAVFSRFNNPSVVLLLLPLLLRLADFLGPFVVIPQKLEISLIFKSLPDMKSQRQVIEHILLLLPIVVGHCIEEGLFVAEHVVVDQVVMHTALLNFCALCEVVVFYVFSP